jgi:hypothetical protein
MDMIFSIDPTVAEGFPFKTWRGAPQAGRTKVPPTAKGLLQRGCSIDQRSIKIAGDLSVIGKFVYQLLRKVMIAPQPGRGVTFPRISVTGTCPPYLFHCYSSPPGSPPIRLQNRGDCQGTSL